MCGARISGRVSRVSRPSPFASRHSLLAHRTVAGTEPARGCSFLNVVAGSTVAALTCSRISLVSIPRHSEFFAKTLTARRKVTATAIAERLSMHASFFRMRGFWRAHHRQVPRGREEKSYLGYERSTRV